MQENWIGRSEGARVHFALADGAGDPIEIFTTRPDTLLRRLVPGAVAAPPVRPGSSRRTTRRSPSSSPNATAWAPARRSIEAAEKRGYDTGIDAVHPLDPNRRVPVYVANFVLMEYGTGAIFGCPAHDQRDLDFARKYELPVIPVVLPPGEDPAQLRGRRHRLYR